MTSPATSPDSRRTRTTPEVLPGQGRLIVEVLPNLEALADAAASDLAASFEAAAADHGGSAGAFVVAAGSAVETTLGKVGPAMRERGVDPGGIDEIIPADERHAEDPTNPEQTKHLNWPKIHGILVGGGLVEDGPDGGLSDKEVIPLTGMSVDEAGAEWNERLHATLTEKGLVRPDGTVRMIALVSMGNLGHYASLFPRDGQTDTSTPAGSLVTTERDSPKPPSERNGLAHDVFVHADEVYILASGDKQLDWQEVEYQAAHLLNGGHIEHPMPTAELIADVMSRGGTVRIYLDDKAYGGSLGLDLSSQGATRREGAADELAGNPNPTLAQRLARKLDDLYPDDTWLAPHDTVATDPYVVARQALFLDALRSDPRDEETIKGLMDSSHNRVEARGWARQLERAEESRAAWSAEQLSEGQHAYSVVYDSMRRSAEARRARQDRPSYYDWVNQGRDRAWSIDHRSLRTENGPLDFNIIGQRDGLAVDFGLLDADAEAIFQRVESLSFMPDLRARLSAELPDRLSRSSDRSYGLGFSVKLMPGGEAEVTVRIDYSLPGSQVVGQTPIMTERLSLEDLRGLTQVIASRAEPSADLQPSPLSALVNAG